MDSEKLIVSVIKWFRDESGDWNKRIIPHPFKQCPIPECLNCDLCSHEKDDEVHQLATTDPAT
jgi:hypothetical protein